MTENHPITPRVELVDEWYWHDVDEYELAIKAARWGADQELEACCELLDINGCPGKWIDMLRTGRRPKPPSIKQQALCHLESFAGSLETLGMDSDLIRRALEQLDD